MELGKLIEALPPELVPYLRRPYRYFFVPTEIVLDRPADLLTASHCIVQGRIYSTDLHWRDNRIAHWREFPNDGKSALVNLCEVWVNEGDDGHVHYCLIGYRLCLDSQCNEKSESLDMPAVAEWHWEDRL